MLIIHPNPSSIACLSELEQAQFQVKIAPSAAQGLAMIYECPPDVVMVADGLPLIDGQEPCLRLRQICRVPIVVLGSGQRLTSARILELGADDYVPESVGAMELIARIRSLMRRYRRKPGPNLHPGEDLLSVTLTPTETRLLKCLLFNDGRIVTKPQLVTEVWAGRRVTLGSLRFHIRRLRQKLSGNTIVNEWGIGYRLSAEPGNTNQCRLAH